MKKTIILIIAIILVIILGVIIGKSINGETKTTNSESVENTKQQNTISNTIKSENSINEVNNIEEKEEEEEKIENQPKTDLERAIEIVKKDWGEDETVYFAEDGITSTGEYIICVRDKATTSAKIWYTVNVEHGTFTKE